MTKWIKWGDINVLQKDKKYYRYLICADKNCKDLVEEELQPVQLHKKSNKMVFVANNEKNNLLSDLKFCITHINLIVKYFNEIENDKTNKKEFLEAYNKHFKKKNPWLNN